MKFNWKIVVMRVVINGLAIAFTAFIMPGITITERSLVNYLILGAVFGLLNAFIKPIIQFLTISLLFVTYGLVIVVVNAIILVLVSWLFSNLLIVSSIWAALIGGAIMSLLAMFIEQLLGMSPPIVDTTSANRLHVTKDLRVSTREGYKELKSQFHSVNTEDVTNEKE